MTEKIFQAAIWGTAFFAAAVLFCFGIRKLKTGKKAGPFMTALALALCILGLESSAARAEAPPANGERRAEKYPESRVLDLNKAAEWKKFKDFWVKLDLIAPKKRTETASGPILEYYGSITKEEADRFKVELKQVAEGLKRLESSQLLYPDETALFVRLCGERIDQMAGFPMSMMTRMVPPPHLLRKEETIGSLERRIDGLLTLKKNGKINQEECSAALKNIQKDVGAFSAYDVVSRGSLGYSLVFGEKTKIAEEGPFLIENLIKEYEARYAEILEARKKDPGPQESAAVKNELDAKYAETVDSLIKLKRSMPFINEAVLDLER